MENNPGAPSCGLLTGAYLCLGARLFIFRSIYFFNWTIKDQTMQVQVIFMQDNFYLLFFTRTTTNRYVIIQSQTNNHITTNYIALLYSSYLACLCNLHELRKIAQLKVLFTRAFLVGSCGVCDVRRKQNRKIKQLVRIVIVFVRLFSLANVLHADAKTITHMTTHLSYLGAYKVKVYKIKNIDDAELLMKPAE